MINFCIHESQNVFLYHFLRNYLSQKQVPSIRLGYYTYNELNYILVITVTLKVK